MNEPDASNTYGTGPRLWGRRIWEARMLVLAAAATVTVGYWAVLAAWQVKEPPVYSFNHVVQFTFDGAEKGLYPDGSPFRITDIIAPGVLSAVYDDSGLDAQIITRRDFVAGFHIQPIEFRTSESEMKAARLSFTADANQALSTRQIGTFLLDVPWQWSEQAIHRGVASKPMVVPPTWQIFDKTLHEELDYVERVRKLQRNTQTVWNSLKQLERRPGGTIARDEGHTGLTTAEIRHAIEIAEEYILNRAFDYINALGLTNNPDTAARIQNIQGRIQRYEISRKRAQELVEAQRAALHLYSKTAPRTDSVSAIESESVSGEFQMGHRSPETDDPSLHRDDVEWQKNPIEALLRSESTHIDREGDIVLMKNLLDKLQSNTVTIKNKAWYMTEVEANIAEFQRRMRDLVSALKRIHGRIDEQHASHSGSLYLSTDSVKAAPVAGAPSFKQAVPPYVLLLFATMAGAMLLTLLSGKDGASVRSSHTE